MNILNFKLWTLPWICSADGLSAWFVWMSWLSTSGLASDAECSESINNFTHWLIKRLMRTKNERRRPVREQPLSSRGWHAAPLQHPTLEWSMQLSYGSYSTCITQAIITALLTLYIHLMKTTRVTFASACHKTLSYLFKQRHYSSVFDGRLLLTH